MNENHIIRVIVQGYDRLSNVMRDAANKSAPALDKLRKSSENLHKQNKETEKSFSSLAQTIDEDSKDIDKAASRVDNLGNSVKKLRNVLKDRLPSITGNSRDIDSSTRSLDKNTASLKKNKEEQRQLFSVDFGLFFDDLKRGWDSFEKATVQAGDTLRQQQIKNAEVLAKFDEKVAARRRKLESQNVKSKSALENLLGIKEENVRSGLATIQNELDDFISAENTRLKNRKLEIRTALAPLPEDVALANSKSKKIPEEEKQAAKDRVNADKQALNEILAAEEAASRDRINVRRREAASIQRVTLSGIEQGTREELAAETQASRQRIQVFDQEQNVKRLALRKSQASELQDLKGLVEARNAAADASLDVFKKTGGSGGGPATTFEIFGRKIKTAVDDLGRGFAGGKAKLKEFEGEAGRAQNFMARLGAQFGVAARSINQIINVRWTLLISLISTLGTVVIELGAALVAVASSAAVAAVALGGALVAGALQAVPVVGLLINAFNQLSAAMKVVQLRQQARNTSAVDEQNQAKARRTSAEQLADANYGLAQSIQSVADAQRGIRDAHEAVTHAEREQKDAVTALAQARKDAARAIVDASLDEKDAALSLQEAELGVLKAKQDLKNFEDKQKKDQSSLRDAQAALKEAEDRLALAKQQGDVVEIAAAQAALSVAKGNVSSLKDQIATTTNDQKDLQTAVKRSQLTAEQARIRKKRADQDDEKTKRQGVSGATPVIQAQQRVADAAISVRNATEGVAAAQRQLRDQQHSVVLAHRAVRDAHLAVAAAAGKQSAAERNAQREFAKLSPGQKKFVLEMEKFQKALKTSLDPITDIIVNSFSKVLDSVITLLKDPAVQKALKELAGAIAGVADSFAKWLIKPETISNLLFFIHEASRNLPIIAKGAMDFLGALINIGKAAAPIFRGLVDGFGGLGSKADKATSHTDKLDKFFAGAGKHLTAWLKLGGAIGNVLSALIGAAAGSGLNMVNGMAGAFNRLGDSIRKNPKPIKEFFKRVEDGLKVLIPVLGKFATKLLAIFTSKNLLNFTKFILLTVIPAILEVVAVIGFLIGAIGDIVSAIDDLLGIPVVSTVGKWVIGWGLFLGIMVKLFPVLKLFKPVLQDLIKLILAAGRAMVIFLVENPWVALIVAIIAVIIILDRHFHFLKPTIEALQKAFAFVLDWVKAHWKELVAALLGPFTLAGYEIYKHWNTIKGYFTDAFNFIKKTMGDIGSAIYDGFVGAFHKVSDWFKGIGGWLAKHIIDPIKRFFGISSPSKLMFKIGMDVVNGFVKAIETLPGKILDIFKGLGGKLLGAIYDKLPGPLRSAIKKVGDVAKKGVNKVKAGAKALGGFFGMDTGGTVPGRSGEAISITAHGGEWILNDGQKGKAARAMGTSVGGAQRLLFGHNVGPKSHYKDGGVVGGSRADSFHHDRGVRFADLPNYEKVRRIKNSVLRGNINQNQFKSALRFWHLIPKDGTGGNLFESAASWVLYGDRKKPDSGLLGAVHQFAQSIDPRNLPLMARQAVESFRHPIRRLQQGGLMQFPGGRIRPILPGGIRLVPEWASEHQGPPQRIPALYLKDKNFLMVGKEEMTHGDIHYYLEGIGQNEVGRSGNAVEVAYWPPHNHQGKPHAWEIYARDSSDVTDKIVDSLQRYKNLDVYESSYDSGVPLRVIARERGGKKLTTRELRKQASIERANKKASNIFRGKGWVSPPEPRGGSTRVLNSTERGNVGESLVAKLFGGKVVSGKGEGLGGHGKFDVIVGTNGIEVKTMSVNSAKYQASPREGEIAEKRAYAEQEGLSPHVAYVIVDPKSSRAYIYSRNDLSYSRLSRSSEGTFWKYHGFKKLGGEQIAPFLKQYAMGGDVGGTREGSPVPIIAHAGEWVVNKGQQFKLAQKIGTSVDDLRMMLFGSKGIGPSNVGRKVDPLGIPKRFPNGIDLVPYTDDYGVELYFLKMADGQYAQVSARAAKRIESSGGTWFPDYIRRHDGGPFKYGPRNLLGFANGGVVTFASTSPKRYDSGGVISGPVRTGPSRGGNTVNQEFNVRTEGESDWNHVMRLAAQKAQEGF